MMSELRITRPRHGDVLTRNDGQEDPEGIVVAVEGIALPGAVVKVNGVAANTKGGAFTCDVRLSGGGRNPAGLTRKRNDIVAETGDTKDAVAVWWNKGSRKRFRFSCDDNILFLKDLGTCPERYPSLFDHEYLGFWQEMHREYGTKVHINIYYQTDGFDLTQMPDTWQDEWRENAAWLHLSFHALQDKPDRPYRNATYAQVAHDFDLVCGHIRRFAGNDVIRNTTTVHWAECPKDAALALRDRGIERLVALFETHGYEGHPTTGYYLPRDHYAYCDARGAWHDFETGLTFVRCTSVVNAVDLERIDDFLDARTSTPHTAEMVELLIHEQYFRKELALYQPDVLDKVKRALRWVTDRGYEPVFWSDGFLGTPE